MFCLVDNESVIHKPEPDPRGLVEELGALALKPSMKRLTTMGLRQALVTCL